MMILAMVMTSCEKDDEPIIKPINYTVTVNFGENFNSKEAGNVSLTLTSTTSNKTYKLTTDKSGKAIFKNIIPDTYNISASVKLKKEEFKNLFGYDIFQDEITFNAVADKIMINRESELTKKLVLSSSKIGGLLFKQIYYAGSDRFNGASFRDLFFEIYNNSNEVIYADKLYFGIVYGNMRSSQKPYTQKDGQYDWKKSFNQTKGDKSNTDYTYVDHIYQIPGNGKDYPIKPGESIVIAETAINHKEPLTITLPNGKSMVNEVKNPELTIDLSNATFEVNLTEYFKSIGRRPYIFEVDNPSVPNMNVIYNVQNMDLILDMLGRDSFILFRTDDIQKYDKLPTPNVSLINQKTKLYMQIPNDIIIDGVEVNAEDNSRLFPRRLNPAIDGGYAFVPKGAYSSQAIVRKVVKEVDGRKILQDTNNSTNDFEVIDVPVPFGWK